MQVELDPLAPQRRAQPHAPVVRRRVHTVIIGIGRILVRAVNQVLGIALAENGRGRGMHTGDVPGFDLVELDLIETHDCAAVTREDVDPDVSHGDAAEVDGCRWAPGAGGSRRDGDAVAALKRRVGDVVGRVRHVHRPHTAVDIPRLVVVVDVHARDWVLRAQIELGPLTSCPTGHPHAAVQHARSTVGIGGVLLQAVHCVRHDAHATFTRRRRVDTADVEIGEGALGADQQRQPHNQQTCHSISPYASHSSTSSFGPIGPSP